MSDALHRSRGGSLHDLAVLARRAAEQSSAPPEMAVLLIYVKADPPAHQLACEMGMSPANAAERLKTASLLLVTDERFRNQFHRLNARLLNAGSNKTKKPATAEDTTSTAAAGA